VNHRATKNTSKRAQRVLSCLCSIIRCLVLGLGYRVQGFKFQVTSLNEATYPCKSAVSFDFGLWTSDIGLTKTIQLLNYLTISLCVSVANLLSYKIKIFFSVYSVSLWQRNKEVKWNLRVR
jgi:hypothetical protein